MLLVASTMAYGGMNWTLSSTAAGWSEAQQACENQGGGLVTPLDQSASTALGQWLVYQSVAAAWIGLTTVYRTTIKDKWHWVGTRPPTGYDGWYTGEPSGPFIWDYRYDTPCAHVYGYNVPAPAVGRWNDDVCSTARQYVCQFAIGAALGSVDVEHVTLHLGVGPHLLCQSHTCVVHVGAT